MYLQKKNKHQRDDNIIFDEEPHIYYINGNQDNISVTTFVHSHFPHFNADKIIKKMMASKNWTKSEYYNQTPEQIKQKWEENRICSSNLGTQLHKDIELYYNQEFFQNTTDEFQYFLKFTNDTKNELIPYRTEWIVYDNDYKLAGSIDMVFKQNNNNDNDLIIYDWKRSKQIKRENNFEKGYPPLDHLPHSNFWHYSLQLNIYKKILEKNYNKNILGLYLLILHPNNTSYIKIKVPDLSQEVEELLIQRKFQLETSNQSNSINPKKK